MSQLVESRLLESTPDTCSNGEKNVVKVMENGSYVFVVEKYSSRVGIGMGKSIDSTPFLVGGYSFIIQLYPDGGDPLSHRRGNISIFVKNASPKSAQLVYDLHILRDDSHWDFDLGSALLDRSKRYHQVYDVPPGTNFWEFHIISQSVIRNFYQMNGSLVIRATIGIVHDHPPTPMPYLAPSFEPCILFQVGDRRYYAKESKMRTDCPALIRDYPQSNHIVIISDLDADVFTVVLWYLDKGGFSSKDRHTICNSKEVFGMKMVAAADKLNLKGLGRLCKLYRAIGRGLEFEKQLWRNVSSWWLYPEGVKEE